VSEIIIRNDYRGFAHRPILDAVRSLGYRPEYRIKAGVHVVLVPKEDKTALVDLLHETAPEGSWLIS
jgi:hypothetical protein